MALWQCFNLQVEGCRTEDQEVEIQEENDIVSFCMQQVLSYFEDVFEEPKGLPPHRLHDHKIPLRE